MKLYKLTDENDRTRDGCQWGHGVCIETSGIGDLCSGGWTHWYSDPLLAVLLNPVNSKLDLSTAHLWEGHDGGGEIKSDRGLKYGCSRGTTIHRVELPVVTTEQHIRFGLGAAWAVTPDLAWRKWATDWLTGEDRSAESATTWWSVWSPWSPVWPAVWSAARAAAAPAATAAVWSADAASEAAHAATYVYLDLISLARWVVTDSVQPPTPNPQPKGNDK